MSHPLECKNLLLNLKTIVDVQLRPIDHDPIRLYLSIQKIILHQLKFDDVWPFEMTDFSESTSKKYENTKLIKNDTRLLWICDRIEKNALFESVRSLISDNEFLSNIYNESAFLRQEVFTEAFLMCLSALERQQINLLSQIDPCLYTISTNRLELNPHQVHRRSNSHPLFSFTENWAKNKQQAKSAVKRSISTPRKSECSQKKIINLNLRPWSSLPNITTYVQPTRCRSNTICVPKIDIPDGKVSFRTAQRESLKVPNFTYTPTPVQATSPNIGMSSPRYDDIEIHFDRRFTPKHEQRPKLLEAESSSHGRRYAPSKKLIHYIIGCDLNEKVSEYTRKLVSTSPATNFIPEIIVKDGEKLPKSPKAANFLDDLGGQSSRSTMPKPFSGQSLTDFLKRIQCSANKNAELDRENAHLIVSEAIIAAIEQLKYNTCGGNARGIAQTCSQSEAASFNDQKSSIESGASTSSYGSPIYCGSVSDTDCDMIPEHIIPLPNQQDNIEADLATIEWEDTDDVTALSAEGVALSLLSKFNDKQLPCASEIMMWMVSEKDAPQQILPLPDYLIANPDEYNGTNTIIRGTKEWAPPRQQIIFTRHPPADRKKIMASQLQRCAGCGMKVAPMYSNRFRLCDYLGKYHCSGCHKNQMSTIPARVLENWEFKLYPVSVFAYRLLDQLWLYPLFRLCDLNPVLYTKIKSLKLARLRRQQLKYINDLVSVCRFAGKFIGMLQACPSHWTGDDVEVWSMSDFVAIKTGSFNKELLELIKKCGEHVTKCGLCLARGFICELCTKKDTIFPWQPKVKRCEKCGTCFHEKCWIATSSDKCPKCERLRKRQAAKVQIAL